MGAELYRVDHVPGKCHYCGWFGFHVYRDTGFYRIFREALWESKTLLGAHWALWNALVEDLSQKLGRRDFLIGSARPDDSSEPRLVAGWHEDWVRIVAVQEQMFLPGLEIVVDVAHLRVRLRMVPERQRSANELVLGHIDLSSMERVYDGRPSRRHPTLWMRHVDTPGPFSTVFRLIVEDTDGAVYEVLSHDINYYRAYMTVGSPVSLLAALFVDRALSAAEEMGPLEKRMSMECYLMISQTSYEEWIRMDRALAERGPTSFAEVVSVVADEISMRVMSG